MASITEDVIVLWNIPSLQELCATQINACNYQHCIKRNSIKSMKSYLNRIHFSVVSKWRRDLIKRHQNWFRSAGELTR